MSRFHWPTVLALLLVGTVAYGLGLPYTLELAAIASLPATTLVAALFQGAVLVLVAVLVGQYFGRPVDLGAPLLEDRLRGEPVGQRFRALVPVAVLSGVAVGAALLLIDIGLLAVTGGPMVVSGLPALWTRVFATFYGGVFEELLLRYGLMTLFVWIGWRLARSPDDGPAASTVWVAIVLASVTFALAHLPIAVASGATISPYVVGRSLLLNGLAGIVFGWLYWRKGLVAAIISHWTTDVALHVVGLTLLDLVL